MRIACGSLVLAEVEDVLVLGVCSFALCNILSIN
jgi:hypothetical protein